jgi:gamma-glutamylcyclotransferase (GGCT)/AIG2-like uncharacterized protein YtfP
LGTDVLAMAAKVGIEDVMSGTKNAGSANTASGVAFTSDTRLAAYGTLAPGRANHAQLAGLEGRWRQGTVRGTLVASGWGAALGFPGLTLDAQGPLVDVHLFESFDLPNHWPRLDAFEGEGYARVVARVSTTEGDVDASIYVLTAENPDAPAR